MTDTTAFDRRHLLGLGASLGVGLLGPTVARARTAPPMAQVITPKGTILGGVNGPEPGVSVQVFEGIPYAEPPTGDRRFAPPVPKAGWSGRLQAVKFGAPAIQMPSPSAAAPTSELGKALQTIFPTAAEVAAQSEDCLYLNVWTPDASKQRKRPVMVWLHGGGFAYGSGAWPIYDGTNLAGRGDVVVVSLNHRLNVFGYLDLPGVKGSGNAGMLDIVMALSWVRDNIALFGGDPGNVTIFGESGGGAKVSYLLAMPAAKGLFHKAIIESGPGVRAVPAERAANLRKDLLAELGVAEGDVAALRALPYQQIIAAAYKAEAKQPGAGFDRSGFSPVVDGDILPAQPWDPKAPAISANVPVMIGINKDEMTLFLASAPWFGRLDEAGLMTQAKNLFGDKAMAVVAALKADFPDYSPTYLAANLITYGRMFAGSVQIATRKADQHRAPAYAYLLEWETPVGPFKSPHTLEIPLVFDNVDKARVLVGEGPAPQVLAKQMSAAWLAFARTGDPNNSLLPAWPAYDAEKRATMVFNLTSRVVDDPYAATRRAVT
ncbi:para-nitrobenzyl esterase [Caulobacter ginsengisoli]|uniref:Carboxylic ester hydrolase n=1 Tax=Caulobacter ginsengisoli TaxID=400775 RepID=A0ABU0IVV8_9CAUL|nr:carboxylesterase/lipase family protein [Caulobacter ginsengisoli]MDQ0466145.1 para-nitrobenzyl esterase [Caulobacter ginsengisoli]